MIKVMLADDHPLIRQGVRSILETDPHVRVTSEVGDVSGLRQSMQKQGPPDVLIMDLSMPGGSGLDTLQSLKRDYPRLPVLVLSTHPEEQYAARAIRIGAAGYLGKETAPELLLTAVKTVLSGDLFVTPKVASVLANQLQRKNIDEAEKKHLFLSDREFQILLLISKGEPLTRIAERFNLSVKTISTYRQRILEKMSMKSNAELIQYVIKHQVGADLM